MLKEGDESELVLKFLKGFCTGLIEGEGNVHLDEIDQRLHNLPVVTDEAAVEVAESQEQLYSFHCLW